MKDTIKTAKSKTSATFLSLAKRVREAAPTGSYDAESNTWSDRSYSNAATKKHNEAM